MTHLPDAARTDRAAFHALPVTEVARQMGSDLREGLDPSVAAARLRESGRNLLVRTKSRSALRVLLAQFSSIVVALLAAAALISLATGDRAEGLAILVVLVLNALIGFLTEWRAERALEQLRQQTSVHTLVRRAGHALTIDAEDVCPGDVVLLEAGDRVPADLRISEAAAARADESLLTGESVAVAKSAQPVAADATLPERVSMMYLGTTLVAGCVVGVVTATGNRTELGKIGRLVAETPIESTPLQRKLARLGQQLVYVVLAIGILVTATGWLRGMELWKMIEVGISLAVAAVPEGLPAVTTLILALGVLSMARRNAVVRRLSAVETLGSATVICTDKTGTLTLNQMTVVECRLSDGRIMEPGPEHPITSDPLWREMHHVAVLCNQAHFSSGAEDHLSGDPTETALITAARRSGMDVVRERAEFPRVAEFPFDSRVQRMITVHPVSGNGFALALKGAPQVVLDLCSSYRTGDQLRPMTPEAREEFESANREMAGRALRVLAVAVRRDPEAWGEEDRSDYAFLGLIGMTDPPRPGVAEAIRTARDAGIRIVMLTGDQIDTAAAIARELRLVDHEPRVIHARDLTTNDPALLQQLVREADVFARVSPEDKLRIVEALQMSGEVVAVTGDGVNDAPALKRADIGVAMGQRGTEVAKEAADVVLTDDNFATIIRAIEGGRTIYSNILKYVQMMFSHNSNEVLVIFLALLFAWPLPLFPLQILWINIVTDIFPALALAVEPPERHIMRRPPRSPRSELLSRRFALLIGWQGAMLTVVSLAAYAWALGRYGQGAHARTLMLFVLVAVQLGHMFNCRSTVRSAFHDLFANPVLWLAVAAVTGVQALALTIPQLRNVLGLTMLTPPDWGVIIGAILLPVAIVEIQKAISRRRSALLDP